MGYKLDFLNGLQEEDEPDQNASTIPVPAETIARDNSIPLEDVSIQGQIDDQGQSDDTPAPPAPSEALPVRPDLPTGPMPFNPAIKALIESRQSPTQNPLKDPLLKDYEARENELSGMRQAKLGADRIANISQSFGQLARGALPPSASAGESIAENLNRQGQEQLKEGEEGLNRRQRILNAIDTRKGRESSEQSRAEDRRLFKGLSEKARFDKQVDVWRKELKQDLDPNGARAGNMGFNQRKADQAERIQNLIHDANGDLRNLDSRQMEELAIGTNALLSNSAVGAASQVAALVPHTVMGNAQKLKEWLLNDPQGTNQQAFVKRMSETVDRERNLALDQVRKAQTKRLGAHETFKRSAPDVYSDILNSYGIGASPQASGTQELLDPSKVKVGDVIEGHRYTGGDPNNEGNWERVE